VPGQIWSPLLRKWAILSFGSLCTPAFIIESQNCSLCPHRDGNALTGTLPASIGNWLSLAHFQAYSNAFIGILPESVGAWTSIEAVRVDDNNLTGPLPSTIGEWSGLVEIGLNDNAFTGLLPDSILNWENVDKAYFHRNEFAEQTMPFCRSDSPLLFPGGEFDDLRADCDLIQCDCCTVCLG